MKVVFFVDTYLVNLVYDNCGIATCALEVIISNSISNIISFQGSDMKIIMKITCFATRFALELPLVEYQRQGNPMRVPWIQ